MPPSRHIGFNRILQRVCAFLFLLAMVKEMPAQHRRGLPDSVVLKDTIQSSENVAQAADSSGANAAEDKKTDDDERLISRIVPDSVVYTAKRDKDFEYANDPAYWPKKKRQPKVETDFDISRGFRWLRATIFLLVGATLLFAFYKIVIENKLYMFYSSSKSRAPVADLEEALKEEDFDDKITESLKANDFRSGIRFMYLKALKRAGEKGLIHFRQQATNQDYIKEIQDPGLRHQFRFLTSVFEYAWYGEVAIPPQRFESLQKQFEHFYKSVGH